MGEAYIVAATRTAGGRKGGRLKDWHPVDLGAAIIDNLVEQTKADPALSVKAQKRENDPAIFTSSNSAGRGTLVMFHDSFAAALQPFLAQHFQRAVYVWQHDWNVPFLDQQKPDVVIDEIAERSFYRGNPASWKNE